VAFDAIRVTPTEANRRGLSINADGVRRSAFDLLAYPDIDAERIVGLWPELGRFAPGVLSQIESDAKYAVYLERQKSDIDAVARDEAVPLDPALDFTALAGLSNELKQRLSQVRPTTLGQASRIEGMTPAALAILLTAVRRARQVAA
jgi:tRNA uridine 5-carboxymethylaminomethyl modification enzyme